MVIEMSGLRTKALALIGVVLLVLAAAFILVVPPAAGYETSLYEAYPWPFWACIIGSIFVGQLVILQSVTSEAEESLNFFIGKLLAVIPIITLTLMPYIRGYPIYGRADVLSHLGMIREIPEIGISDNIYPPMHLSIRSLATATGLEPAAVINILPIVFSIVFIAFMYLFLGQLFERPRVALFVVPLVLFPAMSSAHLQAAPFTLSLLLTPFPIYLLAKEQRTQATSIRAMLLIAFVGVILYHPLTALFILTVCILYVPIKRISTLQIRHRAPTTVTSFSFAVFGAWYLALPGIVNRFQRVILNVLYPEPGDSELATTVDTVQRTSPEPLDLFRIAAVQYGDDLIIFGCATAFLLTVGLKWWHSGDAPNAFVLLSGCIFMSFGFLSVMFLLFDFIGGFGRPLAFGRIFALPLAGALWYTLLQRATTPISRTVVGACLALVLVFLVSLTVFAVFSSPIVSDSNEQVTEMEVEGMEWNLANRNDELLVEEFGIKQYRFEDLLRGTEGTSPTIRRQNTMPPPHFNYTVYETLSQSYDDDRYLLLTEKGRRTYPERFPDYRDQWRYTPDDFEQLEFDRSVNRVYDNGEFNTYLIETEAPSPERGSQAQPSDS